MVFRLRAACDVFLFLDVGVVFVFGASLCRHRRVVFVCVSRACLGRLAVPLHVMLVPCHALQYLTVVPCAVQCIAGPDRRSIDISRSLGQGASGSPVDAYEPQERRRDIAVCSCCARRDQRAHGLPDCTVGWG